MLTLIYDYRIFQQNAAVAAILANRSKIAGSDSESSDDSDSDFTDDDYG